MTDPEDTTTSDEQAEDADEMPDAAPANALDDEEGELPEPSEPA